MAGLAEVMANHQNWHAAFIFVLLMVVVHASHFRGAIITWDALDNVDSTYQVQISWRISWRRSSHPTCDESSIRSEQLSNGEGNLVCFEGCAGTISQLSYYCTDYSEEEDWTSGVNSVIYSSSEVKFKARFTSAAWIGTLNVGRSSGWSLLAVVDLTPRLDTGRPNSSPRSSITPIVRLQHGCSHTVFIPTNDPDKDIVKCRWATSNLECGGVCNAFPNAQLEPSTCTIRYEAVYLTGYFAVALVLEDFKDESSSTPLSQIPLQFLVLVYSNDGPCSTAPEFVDPTPARGACIAVPFNTTYSARIAAVTGHAELSITAIKTVSPVGFVKSPVTKLEGSERHYFIEISWTPTLEQRGQNILCFTAEDNSKLSSEQRCVSLIGGVGAPELIPDSLDPPPGSEITASHSTWRMKYNQAFVKPSQPTFIRFYTIADSLVSSVDVLSLPDVKYMSSLDRSVEFTFRGLVLEEKQTYYILMDPGVVKGTEFCQSGSSPVTDTSFWSVTIKDTTPPALQFEDNPSVSNDVITISWSYNEITSSLCTIQTPDQIYIVTDCGHSWTGTNLTEGMYVIYITGTDEAGVVALPTYHTWKVDLTAPSVIITRSPTLQSNQQTAIFEFICNEPPCTYECSLIVKGELPTYAQCNSTLFTQNGLIDNIVYEFLVRATDQVGNIGKSTSYKWHIDIIPPDILPVASVTLFCGQDFKPSATGVPTVTDKYNAKPSLAYTDTPSSGCVLERLWTATDAAGNIASYNQSLFFSNSLPPVLEMPTKLLLPCSNHVEDQRSSWDFLEQGVLSHPCNRSMNISYRDSTEQKGCGYTFTRQWYVVDDCGNSNELEQTIKILELQLPDQPQNGQVNVDLSSVLTWPQYPGSVQYMLFIWLQSDFYRHQMPTTVTNLRSYQPIIPFIPNTDYLWQVEYVLSAESNSVLNLTIVPSPIWSFKTRTLADLFVVDVTSHSVAFTGQNLTVSWKVENIGSRRNTVAIWYDAVYLSQSPDFDVGAKRVLSQRHSHLLDPQLSYTSNATIRIEQDITGLFYIFVLNDIFNNTEDYSRKNNIRRSATPVEISLTPPSDLVVVDVKVPKNSYSGVDIEVIATIKNVGSGVTGTFRWHDAIMWTSDNKTENQGIRMATVERTNGLYPNSEYTFRRNVSIPRRIFGDFWVSVTTDIFNSVYEHAAEDNNKGITQIPITVLARPALAIKVFEVPTNAVSATTIKLNWIVENIGITEPYQTWNDRVIISSSSGDQSVIITTQVFSGTLDVHGVYSRSVNYIVPSEFPNGLYDVTLYVNYYEQDFDHQDRSSNSSATKPINVTQLLPDLALTHVNATVFLDHANDEAILYLFWRVQNIGDGKPVRKEWVDKVLLSNSSVFSTTTSNILGHVVHQIGDSNEDNSTFSPGDTYSVKNSFILEQSTFGLKYVHIQTDYRNDVIEKNNELSNNIKSITTYIPSRSSDIRVTDVNVKTSENSSTDFFSGQEISVSWTVTNVGNWSTIKDVWLDAVYISRFSFEDNFANRLATVKHKGKLCPMHNYTKTIKHILPDDVWGDLYILVKADELDSLYQIHDVSGKQSSILISLQIPSTPELIVTDLQYTLFSETREELQHASSIFLAVNWTIKNAGNSMVENLVWKDAVIFTREQGVLTSPVATILSTFTVTGNLRADQTYEMRKILVVPESVKGGRFYVYVVSDYYRVLTESLTKLQSRPVYNKNELLYIPQQRRPDLEAIYSLDVPLEITAGQSVPITYIGHNIGGPTGNSWIDAIYVDLSTAEDSTRPGPDALLIHEVRHIGSLESGQQYQVQTEFQVPYSIQDQNAIFIHLDYHRRLDDADENNNYIRVDITILAALFPDLVVSVKKAISVRSGEPFNFTITVLNIGLALVNQSFFNVVYLSEDLDIDQSDIKLNNTQLTLEVGVNSTKNIELYCFMPFDIRLGNYYVIVHVDSRNDVYETDNSNNIAYALVNLENVYSTDLAVVLVVPPSSPVAFYKNMTIQWTLRNNGSKNATGYKCDTTYFSEDRQWSIDDVEIDTLCSSVNVQPFINNVNNDRSYNITSPVPVITPRAYNTIVRSRSNIQDLNLDNNIGVAQNVTHIDITALNLDSSITVRLGLNEHKVFRVPSVFADKNLIFKMTSNTLTDFIEIYVRYDEMAYIGKYDASGVELGLPNQYAVIRKSRVGDYYVLIRKKGTSLSSESPSHQSTVTITAKYPHLNILEVTPRQAAPRGFVTLRISGTSFTEESQASLVNPNITQIDADKVYFFSSVEIYATFNITDVEIGLKLALRIWDVFSSTTENLFPDALTVVDGRPGTLNVRFDNPGILLPSEIGRSHLFVQNNGDSDLLTPIFILEIIGNATFQIAGALNTSQWAKRCTIYAMPNRGPGGILPPEGTSYVAFDIKSNSLHQLSFDFIVTQLPPSASIVNPYQESKNRFKPYGIDSKSWERVWIKFMSAIGYTFATLSAQLSKLANQLSIIGRRIVDMDEMIRIQIKLADGFRFGPVYSRPDMYIDSLDSGCKPAEIVRSFGSRLSHRDFTGLFGKGWTSSILNTKLRIVTLDYVILERGAETLRFPVTSNTNYELLFIGKIEVLETEIIFNDVSTSVISIYHFHKTSYRLTKITTELDTTTLSFSYNDDYDDIDNITCDGYLLNFEYNSRRLIDVIVLTHPDGKTTVTRYTYDRNFEYLSTVEVNGNIVNYTYTADGALESARTSDGVRQNYFYDDNGQYSGSSTYDRLGNLENKITLSYNGSGSVLSYEEPANDTTMYIFDENGNLAYVKRQGAPSYRFQRNYETGSKTIFIGDQILSEEEYDEATSTLTVIDANGAVTTLGYDPNGNVNFVMDGEGNERRNVYVNDLLVNVTFADRSTEEYFYDNDNSLTGYRTRAEDIIRYETDKNRNIMKKDILGEESYYLYDHRGFIVEAENKFGKILITYTEEGFPFTVQYPNGRFLNYSYDQKFHRIGLCDNMGYNISYTYDNEGRLISIWENIRGVPVLEVEFDGQGRVLRRQTGNQCRTEYRYDPRARKVKNVKTSCTDSSMMVNMEYGYDQRNRVIVRNTIFGNWSFRYDATSQLTTWVEPSGKKTQITYDNANNRRVLSEDGVDKAYTVNNLNQYETYDSDIEFEYNENGNLIEILNQTERKADRFVYSADGQLISTSNAKEDCSYSYDALGNLYQKICPGKTTTYLVDPFGYFGADVVAEIIEERTFYYIHASQHGLVAMATVDSNLGIYYYHFDASGSVLGLTDENHIGINSYVYDPFGNIIASEEKIPNSFQYMGQWGVLKVKESTGLYFMRARLYDSRHGRFFSLDPHDINEKSTNMYCYRNNNPIKTTAPTSQWLASKTQTPSVNTDIDVARKMLSGSRNVINPGSIPRTVDSDVALSRTLNPFVHVNNKKTISGEAVEIPLTDPLLEQYSVDEVDNNEYGDLFEKITDDVKQEPNKVLEDVFAWPQSRRPNDIHGPSGFGDARFISVDAELFYKIRFENYAESTTPVQRVVIITQLDDDFDLRTLRIRSYGFGNFTKDVTHPSGILQETVDFAVTLGFYVKITAGLDVFAQRVTWEFMTLDPETGQQPIDPAIGLLPAYHEHRLDSDGYVTFSVRAKRDTPDLAVIDIKATIQLDHNDPIDTPSIYNTVDASVPSVNITVVEETLASGILAVRLQKQDKSSGVKFVDIFVDTESGREVVEEGVRYNIVILDLPMGKTYRIIALPTDNVGNTPSISSLPSESVVEVYFPETEVSCEKVNNCSGVGTCTGENLCNCFPGRYGDACDIDIPPVEPPVIGFETSEFSEDSFVNLPITLRTADTNPDSTTEVVVRNVPTGGTLNHGTKTGEDWHVPLKFLPELAMTPPPNFGGNISLLLIATTRNPTGEATRQVSLPLALRAVADPVYLQIKPTCSTSNRTRVALNIHVQGRDQDGSESITVRVSGVPEYATLSPGNAFGKGEYLIHHENIPFVELISSTSSLSPVLVNITLTSTESSNGDVWKEITQVAIPECGSTEKPTSLGPVDSHITPDLIITPCFVAAFLTAIVAFGLWYRVCRKRGKYNLVQANMEMVDAIGS